MSPTLNQQDVIVRDSIIENKERTKSYWEQLMMAAAAENQTNAKSRVWDTTDASIPNSNGAKNFKNSYNSIVNSFYCSTSSNLRNYVENGSFDTPKICVKADLSLNSMPMEDRIALELQEQKEREEELKRLRKQLFLESSKEISTLKDINNGNEELCSIHTNDDSNFSEYGSEEKEPSLDENNSRVNTPYSESFVHRRTQSLDSVSSGLSSGSGSILNDKDSPRRKVIVRPFEDPQEEEEEEVPAYKRTENETPIEREIRIAKEREEELRKEKGIYMNCNLKTEQPKQGGEFLQEQNHSTQLKTVIDCLGIIKVTLALQNSCQIQKILNKKDAVENDPRDVQHRLATNRIQYEIEEANERENELRTEGKILTTSEETVDSKVTRFTQLAEYAILENRHKDSRMKRSLSVSHLPDSERESKQKNNLNPVKVTESRNFRRYNPNSAQKGLMQRFIATKGKMSLPIINTDGQIMNNAKTDRGQLISYNLEGSSKTPRKGYIPAGEKIQEELKEMKKREEELKLQRAYHSVPPSMSHRHRSQPNLLNLSDDDDYRHGPDDEEGEPHSWTSHKEHPKANSCLIHSVSNPNLLDDGLDKINIRLPNKKFSLLRQWEDRIHSAQ